MDAADNRVNLILIQNCCVRFDQHTVSIGWHEAKVMHPSSSLSSIIDDAPMPMEQRRWVLVLGVLRVDDACYAMTKHMTNCYVTTQNFEKKTALSNGIIRFSRSKGLLRRRQLMGVV